MAYNPAFLFQSQQVDNEFLYQDPHADLLEPNFFLPAAKHLRFGNNIWQDDLQGAMTKYSVDAVTATNVILSKVIS